MRTQRTVVALFGALLLVAGILLLLQALGAAVAVGLFWGVLFLAAAAVFWYLFATGRQINPLMHLHQLSQSVNPIQHCLRWS